MKKGVCNLVVIMVCLIFSSVGSAKDRVVVIPLNSEKILGEYSQPYQYSSSDSISITYSNTTLYTGESAETAPAGKRFFLQNISFQISSETVVRNPVCKARVKVDDPYTDVVMYPLLMTKTTSGTTSVFTSTNSLMLYADPGQSVGVACSIGVSSDVNEYFALSGYFIDL